MEVVYKIFAASFGFVVLFYTWRILNWAYIQPKRLEKSLGNQGLTGNTYKFLYGDLKEMSKMFNHAKSTPINLHDDIKPRVLAFLHKTFEKYANFRWARTKCIFKGDNVQKNQYFYRAMCKKNNILKGVFTFLNFEE
ncbi:hypothetical protein MIMGU_mgv1a0044502mg, partial [Erythranthe guttata]